MLSGDTINDARTWHDEWRTNWVHAQDWVNQVGTMNDVHTLHELRHTQGHARVHAAHKATHTWSSFLFIFVLYDLRLHWILIRYYYFYNNKRHTCTVVQCTQNRTKWKLIQTTTKTTTSTPMSHKVEQIINKIQQNLLYLELFWYIQITLSLHEARVNQPLKFSQTVIRCIGTTPYG